MSINNIGTSSAINYATQNLDISKKIASDSSTTIDDGFVQSDASKKFQEITGKYDLTKISGNDLKAMAKELYDNGLVSKDEKDTLNASADCPLVQLSQSTVTRGQYGTFASIQPQQDVLSNYISEWQQCKKDYSNSGNQTEVAKADNILAMFDKINSYKQS